jgi:hypothetical protein
MKNFNAEFGSLSNPIGIRKAGRAAMFEVSSITYYPSRFARLSRSAGQFSQTVVDLRRRRKSRGVVPAVATVWSAVAALAIGIPASSGSAATCSRIDGGRAGLR